MRAPLSTAVVVSLLLAGCQAPPPRPTEPPDTGEVSPYRHAAMVNTELAAAYMKQGAFAVALEKLRRALDQDPRLPMAHNTIAVLYDRLGETDLAVEHFKLALKYDPANSPTRTNYGGLLCRQGKIDEALAMFERALKDPLYDHPELASVNAASCLQGAGRDPAEVERYLRLALRVNPLLPQALIEMAELMSQRKDYFRTRAYLERYHEVAPDTRRSLTLGIEAETRLGDQAAAADYRMRLQREFPNPEGK